jgi:hypothetical protein
MQSAAESGSAPAANAMVIRTVFIDLQVEDSTRADGDITDGPNQYLTLCTKRAT